MYRTPLSKEVSIEELKRLREQGLSNVEIAKKLNCSPATIGRYLPVRIKKRVILTDDDVTKMVHMYIDDYSTADISEEFGCTRATVYNRLKSRGIKFVYTGAVDGPTGGDADIEPTLVAVKEEPRIKQQQVGVYSGRLGKYLVDASEHVLVASPKTGMMTKDELGDYIRDLMVIWREL